ncbi:response regulator [Vibrio aestuarianus]|uniref:response regulator n=1 Tax=Vibrio aestuarianus TaxID=28171 RepID=UPI00237D2F61|nr:response regulator [Vibrio aestuarianus]MDE1249688.1 response regulator [Vibrio aestuarianus]
MSTTLLEQLNETLLELQQSQEREQILAEENKVILASLSAFSKAENKYQIFEELQKVLSHYIDYDDFIVISKSKDSNQFITLLSSNPLFMQKQWLNGVKFQRVLNGECIILFEPNQQDEFQSLVPKLKNQIQSALITGIQAQTSDSVMLLLGAQKGQFSLEKKATLMRFRPLLERAISDIEHKDGLQKLVELKTRELSIAQQLAEQANQSKSQFLAMMSHELRTPLNSVLGLIDILRDDCATKHVELLGQMETSAELLLVIINDILDLSKIEAGHFELQRNWQLIGDKLTSTMNYHRNVALNKNIEFHVSNKVCHRHQYLIDTVRLSQILFNVVGNAIKFTHSGGVNVHLKTTKNHTLQIIVTDTGIGIDQSRQELLFSPFIQADSSITRNYGGTGLGLAITKHLVELMGGKITVSSAIGQGSTFSISIPLEAKSTEEQKATLPIKDYRSSNQKTSHILVVEDTKTNQMVIKLLLERMSYKVTIVNNGQEAVEYVREHSCTIDLILMDISMPVMDGLAATIKIRQQQVQVPIIALTAHAMTQDKEQCLQAGMNDFVAKPIRSKEIQKVLCAYLT